MQLSNWYDCLNSQIKSKSTSFKFDDSQPILISTDTRTIPKKALYIGIKGESHDGNSYCFEAHKNGASAVITDSERVFKSLEEKSVPAALVENSIIFLGKLANAERKFGLSAKVVAITGSVGKTTVKDLLFHFLSSKNHTYATISNNNNEIGVAKTILDAPKNTEFLILEEGARRTGDISYLNEISEPDVAVLLNARESHIGEFGSFSALVAAKSEMILSAKHKKVVFGDQHEFTNLLKGGGAYSFGAKPHNDIIVEEEKNQISENISNKTAFYLKGDTWSVSTESEYYHSALGMNLAASLAIGVQLGFDPNTFIKNLNSFSPSDGRFKIHHYGSNYLIDDSYNASPTSMKAGITSLNRSFGKQKKWLVLGEMKELGVDSPEMHADVLRFALEEAQPNLIWFVGDTFNILDIIDDALKIKLGELEEFQVFSDVEKCQNLFVEKEKHLENTAIFLKGSRSIRLEKLLSSISTN